VERIRALRHRPQAYWCAAAVLTLVTVIAVVDLFGAARRAKAAYGETVTVAVARRDLAPGTVVGDGDVEARALPRAVVPPGAARADAVAGRTVRWPVHAGEAVLDARLAGPGATGPGALLGPDQVGITVPAGRASPPLAVGTLVALVVPADGAPAAGRQADGTIVDGTPVDRTIVEGTVVAVDAESATVAVPTAAAPVLALALVRGDLVVALRGP
jgi:Flp pilus assembly protein CpaB